MAKGSSNLFMAKSKEKKVTNTPKFDKPSGGCRPAWGLLFLGLAILFFVALLHYDPGQSPRNITDPESENLVGLFGVEFSYWSFYILGGAGWLVPIATFYGSYMFFRFPKRLGFVKLIAIVVCILAAAALGSMQNIFFIENADVLQIYPKGPGGFVGELFYDKLLKNSFGVFGSALVLSLIYSLGILLLITSNMGEAFQKFFLHFNEWNSDRKRKSQEATEARLKAREEARTNRDKERDSKRVTREKERDDKQVTKGKKTRLTAEEKLNQELDAGKQVEVAAQTAVGVPLSPPKTKEPAKPKRVALPRREGPPAESVVGLPIGSKTALATPEADTAPGLPKPKIFKAEPAKKAALTTPKRQGDYQFPPLDLLARAEPIPDDNRENMEETAVALIHTLKTFGITATVDEIHVGPVITRFDILPAPGTKVSRIQGLENDIAMGLKALAVRILAPVPGKGCVGVEIPNKHPQAVSLREIIESEDWNSSRAEIPIGLGKDVSGKPLVADLTKMPHLLIAGSTGSGKTVCINSIIASLLYHSSPEELRFIMVDPKIVEMKVFNDLPHMLIPVVTEPKKVPGALKWLLNEMERRYQLFASIGVRNIAGFHAYLKKEAVREAEEIAAQAAEPNEADGNLPEAVAPEIEVPRDYDEIEVPKTLPYIVCIIDELADLMMVAPAEIETGIARLAQLARAAGIHLILATQRPSVNVITGIIKANLPSRISFKVASKVDSRTILDGMGADQLIGRGDMLFLPPGSARLLRSQGAFVSDDEITALVEFLKCNGPPQFAEDVQRQVDMADSEDGSGVGGGNEDDDLFQDAVDVLRNTKRASTSMLQRRLRIGYNRAARIMEDMEDRGIVGPENGSSPREILVDLEDM